ncbi:SRPBCC family protein [Methylobacterium sp. WSM2598]|uniref:SRPBCC family protein n=1 Tax=Methylobacterium sp. WSM2598 TaxID=398261 RepID=UPI000371707C|nr:SRPBCC family protein [Methylobacterium sp. WSM2598]
MAQERITVRTVAPAPVAIVWTAYTSPEQIREWNFASADWHCPSASVDLREGGQFSSRMEAKDGSMGFDFEGIYTTIVENERIEFAFGDRRAVVEFTPEGDHTRVTVSFDPDAVFPLAQQRSGWQAILDNFSKHVALRAGMSAT